MLGQPISLRILGTGAPQKHERGGASGKQLRRICSSRCLENAGGPRSSSQKPSSGFIVDCATDAQEFASSRSWLHNGSSGEGQGWQPLPEASQMDRAVDRGILWPSPIPQPELTDDLDPILEECSGRDGARGQVGNG